MKGVELGTSKRMSEVIAEVTGAPAERIVVVSGPNLAREIAQRQPTATVIACTDGEIGSATGNDGVEGRWIADCGGRAVGGGAAGVVGSGAVDGSVGVRGEEPCGVDGERSTMERSSLGCITLDSRSPVAKSVCSMLLRLLLTSSWETSSRDALPLGALLSKTLGMCLDVSTRCIQVSSLLRRSSRWLRSPPSTTGREKFLVWWLPM